MSGNRNQTSLLVRAWHRLASIQELAEFASSILSEKWYPGDIAAVGTAR